MPEVSIGINIDVNKLIDQAKDLIEFLEGNHVIVFGNSTSFDGSRVGDYNDSSNWPIIDVPARKAAVERATTHFSYAANYLLASNGEDPEFFQLACSDPILGSNKETISNIQSMGNKPAEMAWSMLDNDSEHLIKTSRFRLRSLIADRFDKTLWVFLLDQDV